MNFKLILQQPWGQVTLSIFISLAIAAYFLFFEILPDQSQMAMIKQQSNFLRAQIQGIKSASAPAVPSILQDAPHKVLSPIPNTRLLGTIHKQGEVYCVFQRNNHITLSKAEGRPC